ncbi:type IV pilus assembly protein PilY1 [Roseateles asaccharophilus]
MMFRTTHLVALLLAAPLALPASAAMTDISQHPLIVANPDAVRANVLFILDDSGSMNFDFLPDHVNGDGDPDPKLCRSTGATPTNSGNFANTCCINGNSSAACYLSAPPFGTSRGQAPFLAYGFNGLAYDPNTLYKPPVRSDGTSWASQTRGATGGWTLVRNDAYNIQNIYTIDLTTQFPDTEWCTDTSYSDCLRNDNYVLPGTVGGKAYTTFRAVQATGSGRVATGAPDAATTEARTFGPHYYRIHTAEYCSSVDLRDCRPAAAGAFTIPAPVRWCNSDANARAASPVANACQATRTDVFRHARFPTKFFTAGVAGSPGRGSSMSFTMTVSGCSGSRTTGVGSLKIGGVEMLTGATDRTNSSSTLASFIASQFRTGTGWTIARSSRTLTITAPVSAGDLAGGYATLTTVSGSTCTFTPTTGAGPFGSDYAAPVTTEAGTYAGRFERVEIMSGKTFPKGANRKDCAGSTCTYDEEMTNFANWWTYYHSRMQTMKSAASLAFNDVGSNRRMGYMSINNNTGRDLLNLETFETSQRSNWFAKLFAAETGNSTPLRTALSKAGRLFAGAYNGTSLHGVTVKDPMQYSCQKNVAILSTDGFWNETSTPTRKDGSTAIGDLDSGTDVERPMLDGNATSNTLADVAYYYKNNDLRTGTSGSGTCISGSGTGADVCGNDDELNRAQTMMTFTLGLGVSGYMQFQKNYLSAGAPDFNAVKNGETANPGAGVCSWQTSGVCNWPIPVSNTLTAVDDMWHAAVNGGGTYFSAASPTALQEGLSSALNSIGGRVAAAAAAATSNPNITATDNFVFLSRFKSAEWHGELIAKAINIDTGTLDTTLWEARPLLDAKTSRNIFMFSASSSTKLKPFAWGEMSATEKAYFEKTWITTTGRSLSQFCSGPPTCLSTTDQDAAPGEPLVSFLRGVRTNEGTDATKYFRQRVHLLGDIVNSEAVYVKQQLVKYADEGYADFNGRARQGMVYVGANDGMLHAFNADTGEEVWAYVPTAVLPNLYKLADKDYAIKHQYFVDATPLVQDVKVGTEWRTILVGGLGAGGRAYYALDITDPAAPKAMWEFTNDNLGLTFGKPEIGKLRDGTWVVVVPSGYNNVSPGDGKGRLFVLNAATGVPIAGISSGGGGVGIATSAGSTATPAGLGQIRGWVEKSSLDNTIERVYGGDNLGNVWRFDINNTVGVAGYDAMLLGVLKNASNQTQPVTTRPELGEANRKAMVYVATGRFLGETDSSDTTVQSVYAIKDDLGATGHGEVRASGNFVKQTLVNGTCASGTRWCEAGKPIRTTTSVNAVNLATDGGWYVDLPIISERVYGDPVLVLGTLVVISNVIGSSSQCKPGGTSWANYFDYRTGAAQTTVIADARSTTLEPVKDPTGKVTGIVTLENGEEKQLPLPFDPTIKPTRRVSWRDLLQD